MKIEKYEGGGVEFKDLSVGSKFLAGEVGVSSYEVVEEKDGKFLAKSNSGNEFWVVKGWEGLAVKSVENV